MSMNKEVLLRVAINLVLQDERLQPKLRNEIVTEIAKRMKWQMLHGELDILEAIERHYQDILNEARKPRKRGSRK